MANQIKMSSKSVFLLVPLLALTIVGCGKKHNDNIQNNGPDNLPLRLQLPRDGSPEAVRILQYAPDNFTRQVQDSLLKQGKYAGGRQVRLFRDDNSLREIRTYWPGSEDKPAQIGLDASFDTAGHYAAETSYSTDGVRETDGHRLPDGTFEQNSFYLDGKNIYKHAILGQVMLKEPNLEWKPFSADVFRDDKTLAASLQRMDDGGVYTQFFDAKHCLVETLHVDLPGTTTIETDYRPDCKTPLATYDFKNKVVWSFDDKGKISQRRKWFGDNSQQYTVYNAGVPLYMQDWEVDLKKSDKTAAPPKIVLYLSWIKELRADETVSREIHFYTGTTTVEKIDVFDTAPKGAKLKAPDGAPALGSTTAAKNWTPPAPAPKQTPTPAPAPGQTGGTAAAGTGGQAAGGQATSAPATSAPATSAPATSAPATSAPGTNAPTGKPASTPPTKTPAPPPAIPAKPSLTPSLTPSFTPGLTPSFTPGSTGGPFMLFRMFGFFGLFGGVTPTTTTQAAPPTTPYWTASGAHVTYHYSDKGNLTEVEYYKAGESTAGKTVKHQDSEHIRPPRLSPPLVKALPAGNPPDKPKDLTPPAPPYDQDSYDDYD